MWASPAKICAIVNRELVINGDVVESPPGLQFNYMVKLKRDADLRVIKERFRLTDIDIQGQGPGGRVFMALREDEAETLMTQGLVEAVATLRPDLPPGHAGHVSQHQPLRLSPVGTSTTTAPFICPLLARPSS